MGQFLAVIIATIERAILAPSFTDVTSIPRRLPAVAPTAVAISYHAPSHAGVGGVGHTKQCNDGPADVRKTPALMRGGKSPRNYAPHLCTPRVGVLHNSPRPLLHPDGGMRDERGWKGHRMGVPSRAEPSISFGGCDSLKMRYARGGGAKKKERERERRSEKDRWDSSRRDEQVSAEKWVSRTGVSAGEYHIATLWRGLRRALHVEGRCIWVHVHSCTRSYVAGCRAM